MRLIDADALVSKCGDYYVEQGPDDGYIGTLKTLVDMQQTVEAYGWEPMDPDKLMAWMMLLNVAKPEWISVKDRLPAETHSIFWPWYGRKEWKNAMWREQSDKVLVTVTFKDGTRLVTMGETHDGEWCTSISKTLNPIVTHWMPFPEPPVDDETEGKRDAEKRTHD